MQSLNLMLLPAAMPCKEYKIWFYMFQMFFLQIASIFRRSRRARIRLVGRPASPRYGARSHAYDSVARSLSGSSDSSIGSAELHLTTFTGLSQGHGDSQQG